MELPPIAFLAALECAADKGRSPQGPAYRLELPSQRERAARKCTQEKNPRNWRSALCVAASSENDGRGARWTTWEKLDDPQFRAEAPELECFTEFPLRPRSPVSRILTRTGLTCTKHCRNHGWRGNRRGDARRRALHRGDAWTKERGRGTPGPLSSSGLRSSGATQGGRYDLRSAHALLSSSLSPRKRRR